MIEIVCLKWGSKYGPEYVNRLHRAILRHTDPRLHVDMRFWCFTDDAQGILPEIQIHDLPYSRDLDTWWNKLWLFSADIPVSAGSRMFYVDLDTVITRDITDLLMHDPDRIVVLRDFYHGIARSAGSMGSGLMSWNHGQYTRLWDDFWPESQKHIEAIKPLGDQRWIELNTEQERDYWQDLFPDRVVSYKVHCAQGLPPKASIICYHGKPSIPDSAVMGHDCRTATKTWHVPPQPWVLDHWRD